MNNRGWTGENYFVLISNDPIDTERSKSTSFAFNLLSTSNDNFCRKGDTDQLLSCFCGKGLEVLGNGIGDVIKIDSSNLLFSGERCFARSCFKLPPFLSFLVNNEPIDLSKVEQMLFQKHLNTFLIIKKQNFDQI